MEKCKSEHNFSQSAFLYSHSSQCNVEIKFSYNNLHSYKWRTHLYAVESMPMLQCYQFIAKGNVRSPGTLWKSLCRMTWKMKQWPKLQMIKLGQNSPTQPNHLWAEHWTQRSLPQLSKDLENLLSPNILLYYFPHACSSCFQLRQEMPKSWKKGCSCDISSPTLQRQGAWIKLCRSI